MPSAASAPQGTATRVIALVSRGRPLGAGWMAALAIGCAGIGVLAGVNPSYALAAVLGIVFVAVVIGDTAVGVVLFTGLSFLEVLRSGGAGANLMKVAGLVLFGSWLAGAATRSRRSALSLTEANPAIVVAGIAFVAWSAASIAWAESSGNAVTGTYRYLLNLLLLPIVFGAIRRREHILWLAAAFVFGAVISTFYGVLHPIAMTPGSQAGRLNGSVGDANEQAAVLVGAIALALGLVGVLRRAPVLRLLAIAAVFVSLAGVINTLSRSGLIALAAMMIAGVVVGGRWRRWATVLVIVTSLGTVGYYVAIAPLAARARVTSADTSGRSSIWKVGLRMVQANPLVGVGSNNFQVSSIHFLQTPGTIPRADLIVDTPKVAHNIYLQVLADLGVPGLLAFLTIVGASLMAAMRAAWTFERSGDQDLELMSRCVVLALVGFMVSDFFLSGEFSKQLWLVLALGPTLLALARSRSERDEAEIAPTRGVDPPRPAVAWARA